MRMEIQARRLLKVLAIAFFICSSAISREVYFKPAPTTVSGTLNPFLLEVGGTTLRKSPSAVTEIHVNGVTLNPREGKGRPFFGLTETDVIEIRASQGFGSVLPIAPIVLPRIEGITVEPAGIRCRTSGGVAVVVWQEQRYVVKSGEALLPIPETDPFLELIYPIDLIGGGTSPTRLYSVRFGKAIPEQVSASQARRVIRPPSLLNFFVGSNIVVQSRDSSQSQSAEIAWTPRFPLSQRFFAQAWAGGTFHKKARGGTFPNLDFGAAAGLFVSPRWLLTLGGDWHVWVGYGGSRFGPSASLAYRFSLGFLERVVASYSAFREDSQLVHIARLGVGLKW